MQSAENPKVEIPLEEIVARRRALNGSDPEETALLKGVGEAGYKELLELRERAGLLSAQGFMPPEVLFAIQESAKRIGDDLVRLDAKPVERRSGVVFDEGTLGIVERLTTASRMRADARHVTREEPVPSERVEKPRGDRSVVDATPRGVAPLSRIGSLRPVDFSNGLAVRLFEDEELLVQTVPTLDLDNLYQVQRVEMVSGDSLVAKFFTDEIRLGRLSAEEAERRINDLVGRAREKLVRAGVVMIRDVMPETTKVNGVGKVTEPVSRYFKVEVEAGKRLSEEEAIITDHYLQIFGKRDFVTNRDYEDLNRICFSNRDIKRARSLGYVEMSRRLNERGLRMPVMFRDMPEILKQEGIPIPYYAPEIVGKLGSGVVKLMALKEYQVEDLRFEAEERGRPSSYDLMLLAMESRGKEAPELFYEMARLITAAEDNYFKDHRAGFGRRFLGIPGNALGKMQAPTVGAFAR